MIKEPGLIEKKITFRKTCQERFVKKKNKGHMFMINFKQVETHTKSLL